MRRQMIEGSSLAQQDEGTAPFPIRGNLLATKSKFLIAYPSVLRIRTIFDRIRIRFFKLSEQNAYVGTVFYLLIVKNMPHFVSHDQEADLDHVPWI
jgi:hypothetical protein